MTSRLTSAGAAAGTVKKISKSTFQLCYELMDWFTTGGSTY